MKNIKTLLTFLSVLIFAIGALLIFQQLSTYPSITPEKVVINQAPLQVETQDSTTQQEHLTEKSQ